MRLISWNVNGFRAVLGKNFSEDFALLNPDIMGLQETKMMPGQADFAPEGYFQYWNSAEKKGYSGTAVFSKKKPICVHFGLKDGSHNEEGRAITLEFDDFYFLNVYTPNAQAELKRINYRMEWENALREYIVELDAKKPVIYCGDLNVAHEEIDLKTPKSNRGSPGFSDEERSKMTELLQNGFTDTFRALYPAKENAYSWWSYRANARANNTGWRIDYFIVSSRLMPKVADSIICTQVTGSDHCPVGVEISL